MPGSSLWLLPPRDLHADFSALIDKASLRFNSPHRFLPHITLTSDISPSAYGSDPQGWLQKLDFSHELGVPVEFEGFASEDIFFRKLYLKCTKGNGILGLAAICRQAVEGYSDSKEADRWATNNYNPHLSLMYHDCPRLDAKDLEEVGKLAEDVGIEFDTNDFAWVVGGRVVLVPTDMPIDQWTPIAEREV